MVASPRRCEATPLPGSRLAVNRSRAMTDPVLQALHDHVAIAQLLHGSCRALDAMDLDAIPALSSKAPPRPARGHPRQCHGARCALTVARTRS
jgi:hypothetical protein